MAIFTTMHERQAFAGFKNGSTVLPANLPVHAACCSAPAKQHASSVSRQALMRVCGICRARRAHRRLQSMPISSAASRSLAVVGMMPWLPTPTGMWSNRDWAGAGKQRQQGQPHAWSNSVRGHTVKATGGWGRQALEQTMVKRQAGDEVRSNAKAGKRQGTDARQ